MSAPLDDEPAYLGRPLSHWIKQLEEGDTHARREACRGFALLGPRAARAAPALVRALADKDLDREITDAQYATLLPTRWASDNLLWSRSGAGFGVTPISAAAEALGRIGKPAMPALLDGLKNQHGIIRSGCAEAMALIGPEAEDAVPALVELLQDRKDPWRDRIGYALGEIGAAAAPAVPLLIEDLTSGDFYMKKHSAETLGRIGPAARAAIPALIKAARHHESIYGEDWRQWPGYRAARKALWRIGPDAIPALCEALRDKNPDVRRVASDTFELFGSEARIALPALLEALKDEDWGVRRGIVSTLGAIGPAAKAASPAIRAMLDELSPDGSLTEELAEALAKIERSASPNKDKP